MPSRFDAWTEEYGWTRNPFSFRIYPDLMIGYEREHQRVRNSIEAGSKFTLLLGETGAGKTNLLRSLEAEYGRQQPLFYMSKPPLSEEDLLAYLRDEVLSPGWLKRRFNSYSLYNIHDRVNEAFDSQVILLVDEGHEASAEVLEWLRTAMDHIDALTVVAAGLPGFEDRLQDEVNTLYSRATDVVNLSSLDKDSTVELIRRRIERVGGASTEPFTQEALLAVYEKTGGFPREVLRLCNDCVVNAAEEGKSIIDADDVRAAAPDESAHEMNSDGGGADDQEESEGTDEAPDTSRLTEKQSAVFDAVESLGTATSGEIVEHLGTESYKSRDHAIRSVNNILRRLMEQELVERERQGRNYLYSPRH